MGRSVLWLAIVGFVGFAGFAENDRVTFTLLRDENASTCPDDVALRERVRERIGSEPFAEDGERMLRVDISHNGAGLQARVALFSKAGKRLGFRILRGDGDCEQLADELVLVIAIAIDPLLLLRSRPKATLPMAPGSKPPIAATGIKALGASTEASPGTNVVLSLPRTPGILPSAVAGRALVSVASGVGSPATPSVRVEASLDYGLLDFDAGVRFDAPARVPISTDASIYLTLFAADMGPCAGVDFNMATLRGCAVAQAGTLIAQTSGLTQSADAASPWLALGLRGTLGLRLWPRLAFVLSADVQAPLVRARFIDEITGRTFAQPGLVAATLGIGLELQVW